MATNDSLKTLHTALIDARKGYETARDDAEMPEMKALFERMLALHEGSHQDVHRILVARGETPDDGGSFMATVHKAVISVRSAVSGLDRNSLSSFADGEERIVAAYDEAIRDNATNSQATALLGKQRAALVGMIGEMKGLAE